MEPLLSLALALIVLVLVIWLLVMVINAINIGELWRTVILALVVIALLIVFARQMGWW